VKTQFDECSLLVVATAAYYPTCAGCDTLLEPRARRGGSERRWCGSACRTFAHRREFSSMRRARSLLELEAEAREALLSHLVGDDLGLSILAAHLLELAGQWDDK